MKSDATGYLAIEVKRLDRFLDVGTQFVPRVALREDALGEALRAKAAVGVTSKTISFTSLSLSGLAARTQVSWQSQSGELEEF